VAAGHLVVSTGSCMHGEQRSQRHTHQTGTACMTQQGMHAGFHTPRPLAGALLLQGGAQVRKALVQRRQAPGLTAQLVGRQEPSRAAAVCAHAHRPGRRCARTHSSRRRHGLSVDVLAWSAVAVRARYQMCAPVLIMLCCAVTCCDVLPAAAVQSAAPCVRRPVPASARSPTSFSVGVLGPAERDKGYRWVCVGCSSTCAGASSTCAGAAVRALGGAGRAEERRACLNTARQLSATVGSTSWP
jgi:hypothetical protein